MEKAEFLSLSVGQLPDTISVVSKIAVPKALALELEWSQVLAAHFSIGPEQRIGSFGKHPCTHRSGSLFLESE